jgi:hypothetical protein
MRGHHAGVLQEEEVEGEVSRENQDDYANVLARLSTLALLIVLGTGIAVATVGYLYIRYSDYTGIENVTVRNILFVLGLLELAAIQVLKISMLGKIRLTSGDQESLYARLTPATVVIAAMCSSISIYGLVATILGSSYEVLLLFVAISLIGYQLFRIRNRDLKRLKG